MLGANYSLENTAMGAFKSTLSDSDKVRLDREIDSYAKELIAAMLFRTSYEDLLQMLSEREISPLLFQWSLAIREGMNGPGVAV